MADNTPRSGIIGWFAGNPVAANLLMLLIIALGITQMGSLRREAFPSMEPNSITIMVIYQSGSARQSEEGIAMKIEEALEGVTGVDSITSQSIGSSVTVTVEKQTDYDLDVLLRDVKAKVDAITNFPVNAENPVIEKAEREEHALWLQLYGDTDRHALQQLSDELKRDMLDHAQINRVTLSGRKDPMMVIEIDEGRLQAYGLSLDDVETIINQGSSSTMTATLSNENTYLQLKASEQAYRKQEFAQIPLVTASDGSQLRLGDVATIRDTFDDETAVLSRFNGHNSIGLQVVTTGQDDIADTVAAARDVVAEWRSNGILPENVKLATWYDRSTMIMERLQLLVQNALFGIMLVFALLALFLNLRVAFWVAAGLPFVFFGTLFFMGDSFLGLSLNEFTTFGFILALGIVVDDAVVVGESIYTNRRRHGDTLDSTIKGTMDVAIPTLFGVLTTVAAFYALSFISGNLGELYAQFAAIVAICLVLSVIESKLILPAHLAHLNTHRKPGRHSWLNLWQTIQSGADAGMNWFNERCYRPLIQLALKLRYAVVLLFLAIFVLVVSMPLTGALRVSFFPAITGDTVNASLTMQNDTTFGQTHRNLLQLEQQVRRVDRELTGDDGTGIANLQVLSEANQAGSLTVQLVDNPPYSSGEFTRRWRELAGIPAGAKTLSIQNTRQMVDALRIELRANDDKVLGLAGAAVKQHLDEVAGVSGIEDNLEPGQPQLHLSLNQQGRALGLTTDELAIQLLQAFRGQIVQRYQRNNDEIEVRVRYPEAQRQNAVDVMNARVRTSDGEVVPLSSVANVNHGYTYDSITRIDGKRAVYISADVDKDRVSSTELVARLQSELVPELERQYPAVDIHFAGEAEEQAETQSSMEHMFLIALLAIYVLIAIPLRSYIQPLIIMSAIPFGIVGAMLGHWINDLALGILSLNGIIALSGVVVNDSLLLVARFNHVRNGYENVQEAISEACRSRLRAVLLTSFTTFAGLMPLLSETSMQAQFLIPAAVALAYGIIFATVITLILIPAMLLIQIDLATVLRRLAQKTGVDETTDAEHIAG